MLVNCSRTSIPHVSVSQQISLQGGGGVFLGETSRSIQREMKIGMFENMMFRRILDLGGTR